MCLGEISANKPVTAQACHKITVEAFKTLANHNRQARASGRLKQGNGLASFRCSTMFAWLGSLRNCGEACVPR